MTLIGELDGTSGREWWNGLKRIDVGSAAGGINVLLWAGSTPNPVVRSFAGNASPDPVTLEIARIGAQFVFSPAGSN